MSIEEQEDALLTSLRRWGKNNHWYLRKGMYAFQLRQWRNELADGSLLVLNYEDLERDSQQFYNRVLEHIGLPEHTPKKGFKKVFAGKYGDRTLSNETRRYLEKFYEPYNMQLRELLGEEWKGVWTE